MKQIRKILRDKRGEGYIDVAVMVLCVMLVIALGVRLFPIFITKMQVDNFADELVREAEISGRVGSETSNRQRVLEEKTGIHPAVQWSNTGNLQLNEEVICPCPYRTMHLEPVAVRIMQMHPYGWKFRCGLQGKSSQICQ